MTDSEEKTAAKWCNKIARVLSIPLLVYEGWVIHLLWRWFIVTQLGAHPIDTLTGIGIGLLGGIVSFQFTPRGQQLILDVEIERLVMSVWIPTMYLVIGFTAHKFM